MSAGPIDRWTAVLDDLEGHLDHVDIALARLDAGALDVDATSPGFVAPDDLPAVPEVLAARLRALRRRTRDLEARCAEQLAVLAVDRPPRQAATGVPTHVDRAM